VDTAGGRRGDWKPTSTRPSWNAEPRLKEGTEEEEA
jgi:hypothetical protein